MDWSQPDTELQDFTRALVAFRKQHPVFRRRRFLAGEEAAELCWYTPSGSAMTAADWSDPSALATAFYLDGSDAPDRAADGTLLLDDDFLVLVNAWWEPLAFTLPATKEQAAWRAEIDTYDATVPGGSAHRPPRVIRSPSAPGRLSCSATRAGADEPAGTGGYRKMLTARAITRPIIFRELTACTVMASFAHRTSGITSVGLNAVASVAE